MKPMKLKLNDDIGGVKFNGAEIDVVKFNGAEVWSSGKEVSGVPPLTLANSKGKPLKDYKIYGNSVQSSTPSASAPVEIESVGDVKNLFDLQGWYTWLKSFGTSDTYVKKVTVDGISCILYRPPGTYDKQYMKGEFKENTQYALSFRAKGITGSGVSTGFRFKYTDGSSSGVDVAADGEWKDYETISKADKTIDYIWMWFAYDQGCYIDENSVQLEEGAAATEYVPYGKYVIPVEVSENVYMYESFFQSPQGNYPVEKLNDTSIHIGAWYQCIFSVSTSLFKPNTTYAISKDLEVLEGTSTNVTSRIALATGRDSGGFMLIEGNQTVNEFTTPGDLSGYKYLWIYGNSASINISNIEIREKESAVQTVNIVLSEPLRKIGSYADYIDFKNQKLVRNVNNNTFNGTSRYVYAELNRFDDYSTYGTTPVLRPRNKMFINAEKCNYCPQGWRVKNNFHVGGNYNAFLHMADDVIGVTSEDDTADKRVAKVNAWLKSLSPSLYIQYVLETPTETSMELPEIGTFSGNTTIKIKTAVQPSSVSVIYR